MHRNLGGVSLVLGSVVMDGGWVWRFQWAMMGVVLLRDVEQAESLYENYVRMRGDGRDKPVTSPAQEGSIKED